MVLGLLVMVVILVLCSVYAPNLQSSAVDSITNGNFGVLPSILLLMICV